MKQASIVIIAKEIRGRHTWLRVSAAQAGIALRAGQFCMVRCGNDWSPYLRRALFPAQIGGEEWVWAFEAGNDPGLAWLAAQAVGSELDCLGPCGNGFSLNPTARNLLLVAEPESLFALLPLVEQGLAEDHQVMFLTSATVEAAYPAARLPLAVEYTVIQPQPGQRPWQALTRPLLDLVGWADQISAAGSLALYGVLRSQIEQRRLAIPQGLAYILTEATFGCGFGACLSCVVELRKGHHRACLRGPVFDLAELA